MPADYIPRSDGEFRVWLEDWLTGARRHGPRLRVMPEQLQRAADATRAYVEALDAHKLAQSCARSARENRKFKGDMFQIAEIPPVLARRARVASVGDLYEPHGGPDALSCQAAASGGVVREIFRQAPSLKRR